MCERLRLDDWQYMDDGARGGGSFGDGFGDERYFTVWRESVGAVLLSPHYAHAFAPFHFSLCCCVAASDSVLDKVVVQSQAPVSTFLELLRNIEKAWHQVGRNEMSSSDEWRHVHVLSREHWYKQ